MGVLFIFILISVLVISALLFFNKGEKAQEIKTILKDIYENFKKLLSNLKKLFLILKELIQSTLDQEPTQIKDESKTDNSSDDSTKSQPEISPEPESVPTIELETSSDVPIEDQNSDEKTSDF